MRDNVVKLLKLYFKSMLEWESSASDRQSELSMEQRVNRLQNLVDSGRVDLVAAARKKVITRYFTKRNRLDHGFSWGSDPRHDPDMEVITQVRFPTPKSATAYTRIEGRLGDVVLRRYDLVLVGNSWKIDAQWNRSVNPAYLEV